MIISTDSCANLPKNYYRQYDINMIPMQIVLDEDTYDDLTDDLPIEEYYQRMREGAVPTTAQINEYNAREYFESLLERGEDIIHISFSSALSGSYDNVKRVADDLNAVSNNKIVVIDSLNASVGQGLLVLKAKDLRDEGKSIDDITSTIKSLIPKTCSYFNVDQLKYLVRGGRVGKLSGVVGSLLNIKPVLRVDDSGRLVSYKKVISRKKALSTMADIVVDKIDDKKYIYIAHAVCEKDAQLLADELKTRLDIDPIITDLTQVIGCHTGPGLVAVFFLGREK